MTPARFYRDGDDRGFPGWHDPAERWNGWACPRFTRSTLISILGDGSAASGLIMEWLDGAIRWSDPDGAPALFRPETVPGVPEPVYSMPGWTWYAERAE